jgi:hypothetical protein
MLFLIFYSDSSIIASSERYHLLPTFKFASKGTYFFSFREIVADTLQLAILDDSEYSAWLSSLPDGLVCNDSLYFPIPDDLDISDSVTSAGLIHPILSACKRGIFGKVSLKYQNPQTNLDLRVYPAIRVQLGYWIVLLFVCVGWGIFLWRVWEDRRRMQVSVGILIVLDFVHHLCRFVYLEALNKSDGWSGLGVVNGIVEAVAYIGFAHVIVLAASGLSVISEELAREVMSESLIASVVLVLSLSNLLAWDVFPVFVQGLVAVVGLLVYAHALFTTMHEGNEQITVMILNTETRANATEAKHKKVVRVLMGGAAFLTGYVLLTAVVGIDAWLKELLMGFGEIAVILGLVYVYSPGLRKWPTRTGQGEGVGELLMADIDEVPVPSGNAAQPMLGLMPETGANLQ